MSERPAARLEADLLASELIGSLAELRQLCPDLDQVVADLLDVALFQPAHDIVSRTGKGLRARLVEHSWALAGGRPREMPSLLTVSIELLHAGSLVIDDIEDDSAMRRGQPTLHHRYGLPIALNTGNWLYFAALSCLSRIPCDDACRLALTEDITQAVMRCHEGQALDVSVSVTALPRADVPRVVAATTALKTGTLIGLAAVMGARCAGAPPDTVERLRAFGSRMGGVLQMLDDWSSIRNGERRDKGLEDLRLGRATWPWAWLAEHADQVSYAEVVRRLRGTPIEWELDRVRQGIATRLEPVAPGLIETELDRAMSVVRSGGVDRAAVDAVESELEALMCAYG